ncbi:hypothetical protein A3F65_04270 [Candidatus Saccharibacteria bacterium RIFCSPHIGHO2_12_FULL_47_16b]|nr:MAG: hypothetical protein A3F65_04270 [Candidatus Saccharibacteria bacterium RIFCSPHIGHO2_12_FULL_47_16b]
MAEKDDFEDEILASEPGDEIGEATSEIEELTIEEATEAEIEQAKEWVAKDAEAYRAGELSVNEPPIKKRVWTLKADKKPIAHFQLKKRGPVGEVLFVVKPSMRNLGLGRALLKQIEFQLDLDVVILKVFVDEHNLAGQRTLLAAGYQPAGQLDGLIEFRKRVVKFKDLKLSH